MRKWILLFFLLLLFAFGMLTPYAVLTGNPLPFGIPAMLPSAVFGIGVGSIVLFEHHRWVKKEPEQKSKGFVFVMAFCVVLSVVFAIAALVF